MVMWSKDELNIRLSRSMQLAFKLCGATIKGQP
jgi:hypothetical protein